ncbi:hypothetical protein [Acidihalobacter prosperus]|uniref:Uncharacterized protein n=1 Tax=Acidihalobacter prosperus TaxID=160660 RepID=A0A1A6C6Q1_9GAMM|nr:hypothetical protein [Acidihalobacter prosperus]OBS10239.1 hypothetical protein Thpro_021289 [Acidihalobacter prosperus]
MLDLPGRLLIAALSLGLLGGLHGARGRRRDDEAMRDRALAVAAMVQAAGYAREGLPRSVRPRIVTVVLRLDAASTEFALGGRRALASGLSDFLRLATLDVADYAQAPLLDQVHRYVRIARRLRRRRRLRLEMALELRRIAGLANGPDGEALDRLARRLLPRRVLGDLGGHDAALIWLYGLRAAWSWCEAGGGRSPFGFVPRDLILAARELLDTRARG